MIWTEYHKYPEGMSLLNFYKLKNLHVFLTGLANKTGVFRRVASHYNLGEIND